MNCIVAHSAVGVQLLNMRYHTKETKQPPPAPPTNFNEVKILQMKDSQLNRKN